MNKTYRWEAEKEDGTVIAIGGDLAGCVRFSLIPAVAGLPQHDLVGVKMISRFRRVFHKIHLNDFNDIPAGGLGWEEGSIIVKAFCDLRELIKPGYSIRQWGPEDLCPWCLVMAVGLDRIIISEPYRGKSAEKCRSRYLLPRIPEESLECVVCEGFRMYVKSSTGAVLITPQAEEVYL
jgi:hypothetical protein